MKHDLKITVILVLIFLIAQIVGLGTLNQYIKVTTVVKEVEGVVTERTQINHSNTILGQPPEVQKKTHSYLYILAGLLIGTALVLLIIKFKKQNIWRFWFFVCIFIAMSVAFGVYINKFIAMAIAFVLTMIKMFRPTFIFHNLTEIVIYAGIAVIFIPLLNLFSAVILLILISIYDMIAVWKSKHMITLAKFQVKSRVFAGLLLPYTKNGLANARIVEKAEKEGKKEKIRNAILGGGDIAFPLLFSGAVMENLILIHNVSKPLAFLKTLIIPVFAAVALLILLYFGKKDKFYPAMPFLSIGCFAGYGVLLLLNVF